MIEHCALTNTSTDKTEVDQRNKKWNTASRIISEYMEYNPGVNLSKNIMQALQRILVGSNDLDIRFRFWNFSRLDNSYQELLKAYADIQSPTGKIGFSLKDIHALEKVNFDFLQKRLKQHIADFNQRIKDRARKIGASAEVNDNQITMRIFPAAGKKIIEIELPSGFLIHIGEESCNSRTDCRVSTTMPEPEILAAEVVPLLQDVESGCMGIGKILNFFLGGWKRKISAALEVHPEDYHELGSDLALQPPHDLSVDKIVVAFFRSVLNQTMFKQVPCVSRIPFVTNDTGDDDCFNFFNYSFLSLTQHLEYWKKALNKGKITRTTEISSYVVLLLITNPLALKQALEFHHLDLFFPQLAQVMKNFDLKKPDEYTERFDSDELSLDESGLQLLADHVGISVAEVLERCVITDPVSTPQTPPYSAT